MPGGAINQRRIILTAGSASATGQSWFEATGYLYCTVTVRVTQTATLAATMVIRGTNQDAKDANEAPILVAPITALPAGWTVSSTTGVITLNATGSGTFSATFSMGGSPTLVALPSFILPDFTYTSGGGTFGLTVTAAGWS
jgi:hypothetical protein